MGAPRRSLNPFWGWGLGPFPHGSYGNVDADFDQIVDNELEAIEQVERCGAVTSFQGLYGETRPPGYWASVEIGRRARLHSIDDECYMGRVFREQEQRRERDRRLALRDADVRWHRTRAARLRKDARARKRAAPMPAPLAQ